MTRMKILIVNRNTPDLAENQSRQIIEMASRIPKLQYLIIQHNCTEEPFRGKLYGHHILLQQEREEDIDYYWFNQPDLSFAIDMNCLKTLLEVMEENPQIAVLSPTEASEKYISMHKAGVRWHPVATCDYLSLLIRGSVIDEIGFLNPAFEYSYGAIHEYSYKVYGKGWLIAYCDAARMHHFGGTTYGGKGVVSRKIYQTRAWDFAGKYFVKNYGEDWDRVFAAQLPRGVVNNYKLHRRNWEARHRYRVLYRQFLKYKDMYLHGSVKYMKQRLFKFKWRRHTPIRLHLGCGRDYKKGWVNVDIDRRYRPDLVADAKTLEMIPGDSVDEIESYHLFEHFTYYEALQALETWHRILKEGGRLSMELPDFRRCIEMLSQWNGLFDWRERTPEMFAYGGIYGDAKLTTNVDTGKSNIFQTHKYGWTYRHLETELINTGFKEIRKTPIQQTERLATLYDRDMRVECFK